MPLTPKIFVSVPSDNKLDQRQIKLKEAIRRALKRGGYDLNEFGKMGIPRRMPWTYDNIQGVLRRCQGAAILAFNVGSYQYRSGETVGAVSEYNHIEGTLALAQSLPLLVVTEEDNSDRGILRPTVAHYSVIPTTATSRWVLGKKFKTDLQAWSEEVNSRYHVFLGYSSGARTTAAEVKKYLQALDVRVLDWMKDFHSGGTVLDEIQQAEKQCMGGIFLFTKDDAINSGGQQKAAPRDNVIFEAGYFMNTKGKERTLLICEEGVKIPADVGGNIYLPLTDRHDIATIENDLRKFIEDRF